ncbi:MAG: NADH-quinone oxidoreductase subunit NuoH [Prevotella sp.]|jgi:NADH-quinone oxidoreductase subunit H|nr:NADH-quinone oxidoreductase subunit NuoH [Prevotella sp.]MCH3968896.1 NADH-quinone oxidoreductase subunit NuoH [Prevotella sp.]MCH3985237.1 NADH-quinone oxidoreductase subunit NuoH [Prevotella sp.]MCH3992256.1 NADH-quinone oxidoreductase subunit NuoH [Prevotella sp.]MCH4017161.1 NADH-quinone oxidoreductase subunit NuoH [Prevotella sp.]MCH4099920.1 NADH-quinone oxidoreductase subunit NuoH [Prevotella sp.]
MFDFGIVTRWFDQLLRQTCGLGNFWSIFIECVVVLLLIIILYALLAIVLIFMERKVCAYFQCRLGPMRVGPWGVFQVFADVVKMLIKEIFPVDKSDKLLYYLAPFLVITASIGTFSFLPWNKGAQVLDFNVGVFMITALSSIGIIGVFMAGWGSNNKYSVVSAMRGAVQMISYEMSLGLCLVAAVTLTGTMQVSGIVDYQAHGWLIFRAPLPAIVAFLIFLIAGNAEANRGPFDLVEAESELTAGYHTEYSGMGFGFYYLSEYLNLFVISGIAATVFLGGWMPLHIGVAGFDHLMDYIPGFIWMLGKTFVLVFFLMWIRWTFPRLRIDNILKLEWKYLMPLSLLNLVVMTVCVVFKLGWHI